MLPSLMKRLSKTFSITRSTSTPDRNEQSSSVVRRKSHDRAEESDSRSSQELSLRRQATLTMTDEGSMDQKPSKQMKKEPSGMIRKNKTESGPWEKSEKMSTRTQTVPSRQVTKTYSKRLSSVGQILSPVVNIVRMKPFGSQQISKKMSAADRTSSLGSRSSSKTSSVKSSSKASGVKSSSKTSSVKSSSKASGVKSSSKQITKTMSRQLSSANQTLSQRNSAKQVITSLSKRSSTARSLPLTSPTAALKRASSSSVKATTKRKAKVLWYLAGTYVTVRNDEESWFLCRLTQCVFNTSKSVKIRWLSLSGTHGVDENTYKLESADEIDPGCILLNVRVMRNGRKYRLLPADQLESDKLANLANRIAKGEATVDELDSDVEEVIQIEPPPVKKRKIDTTSERKVKRDTACKDEQKVKKERKKKEPKEKKMRKTDEKKEPKKRKPTKKQLEMMLHPKPNIKVQEKDIFFETSTPLPFVSKYSHSKLAFRAVIMKDYKLLKKLLKDNVNIYWLHHNRSVAVKRNALIEAIIQNDKTAVDLLMKDFFFNVYADRLKNNFPDQILINKMDTGSYNFRSRGIQFIRQIMAGRGSREGNNALIKDVSDMMRGSPFNSDRNTYINSAIQQNADFDLIKMLSRGSKEDENMSVLDTMEAFNTSMVYGHHLLAAKCLEKTSEGFGGRFSKFHIEVLKAGEKDEISCSPYQVKSTLKAFGKITPVHCAAINPNKKHLEKLLSVELDSNVTDKKGRRPLHFAAACSSSEPLQYLLDQGAHLYDTDGQGQTPLIYAIQANRPHNVELFLKMAKKDHEGMFPDQAGAKFGIGRVNKTNRNEKAPIHIAVEKGYLDIVEILIKHGASIDLPQPVSKFKVTPLMIAAGCGYLPMSRFLVQQGATVQLRDRLGRSSVIHAAMNGSTNVLSYLLNLGADPDRGDNSANTPLHYACAYGWYFCAKLLLEAGANANVANDWKTTPASIAYQKGHFGIVNLLLTESNIDINFQDDHGMTLLSTACSSVLYNELYDQIIYLVKTCSADCSLHDTDGNTPLHHLAKSSILLDGDQQNPQPSDESMETSVNIAKVLFENGCDPMAVNEAKESALDLCTETGNMKLMKYLINQGCMFKTEPDETNSTLLHSIANTHMNSTVNVLDILQLLVKQQVGVNGVRQDFHAVFCNMAKVVDNNGHLPIILACKTYACCRKTSSSHSSQADQLAATAVWQQGRDFIRFLIEELNSDVDAVVQKKHYANEEERPEKEEDQYIEDGLKSVVHYLCEVATCEYGNLQKDGAPVYPCLRMILEYKPDVNVRDVQGQTPLTGAILDRRPNPAEILLMEGKADPNSYYVMTTKETKYNIPAMILAAKYLYVRVMECLIQCGADVNATDPQDRSSALHHAIITKNKSEVTLKILSLLLDGGADVNAVDDHKRTPMHLAVNLNPGHMDSSFDVEILLMKHGASLNMRDIRGRLPLHYVFVKRKSHTIHTENDPIDLCHLIVSNMVTSDLNVKDRFGQTCLHRAAFRGGQISCMYLLQKGLQIDAKDNDGNTPLAMSILGSHDNCAAILIQNGASIKEPIYKVTGKQTVPDSSDGGEESVMDDIVSQTENKEAVKPVWKWKPLHQCKVVEEIEKTPLFEMAVRQEMQGVCFLVSEKSGVTFADAVEIGLKLQKYNIVLRLISTTVDHSPLKEKREHGRTLLHIITLTASPFSDLVLKIVDTLISSGVSLVEEDDYGCTPLLYASLRRMFNLGRHFLKHTGVYKPEYKDSFGRSVLVASLWKGLCSCIPETRSWIQELVERKGNLDELFDFPVPDYNLFGEMRLLSEPDYWQKYPHEISPLLFAILHEAFDFTKWLLKMGSSPDVTDSNRLTPLMYAARVNDLNLVKVLLNPEFDPKAPEEPDKPTKPLREQSGVKRQLQGRIFQLKKNKSDGQSMEEDSSSEEEEEEMQEKETLQEIKTVQKTSCVNVNASDDNGWTVLHHIAAPLSNGSFDNHQMVYVLHTVGLNLNTTNQDGDTALDLAVRSGAARVARMIQKLNNVNEKDMRSLKLEEFTVIDGVKWTSPPPSLQDDVDAVMKTIVDEPMDVDDEFVPEISYQCNVTNGTLVQDEDQDTVYSALLTKVDVSHGPYGLYNFYQLQLIYQPGKDLYILFTRWGRIGDEGQFQHTPFQKREDGVKEFCKVFKEKTGNKWEDVKNFNLQPKKYRLVPESMQRQACKQKDIEFDHRSPVRSSLPEHLYELMQKLTNVKSIMAAFCNEDIDSEIMPFGKMDRQHLLKARHILDQIGVCLEKMQQYQDGMLAIEQNKKEETTSKYQSNCEQIAALSSEYFQIIPQKMYAFEKIQPLDNVGLFKKQMALVSNLLDYEVASKMLLGAMFRKEEINPLDYVYQTMGCKLELLKEDDWESQYILKYIYSSVRQGKPAVEAVYKVEIPKEGKHTQKKDVGNRKLLWHGSGFVNFLSILHRGLVISPPEAPVTGHAFGKGIYFSDSFLKSCNYCHSPTETHLMLLCEVALGKSKQFISQYMGKTELLEKGCDSLQVVGSNRPDDKHSGHLSTGVEMPLGNCGYDAHYKNEFCCLNNSEFIIFDKDQVSVRYLVQFRKC